MKEEEFLMTSLLSVILTFFENDVNFFLPFFACFKAYATKTPLGHVQDATTTITAKSVSARATLAQTQTGRCGSTAHAHLSRARFPSSLNKTEDFTHWNIFICKCSILLCSILWNKKTASLLSLIEHIQGSARSSHRSPGSRSPPGSVPASSPPTRTPHPRSRPPHAFCFSGAAAAVSVS